VFSLFGIPFTGIMLFRTAKYFSSAALWWSHIMYVRLGLESKEARTQRAERRSIKRLEVADLKQKIGEDDHHHQVSE